MKKVMLNIRIESNSKNTEKTLQKKKSHQRLKRKKLLKKLKNLRAVNLKMKKKEKEKVKTLEVAVEVDPHLILTQIQIVINLRRQVVRKRLKRARSKIKKMSLQVVDHHQMIPVAVLILRVTQMMVIKYLATIQMTMTNFKLKESFQQNINSC